jgi:membrane associated rhomboid family serine protease
LGWLQKLPFTSLLIALAIATVPFWIASEHEQSSDLLEASREEARTFLVRNPQLEVDSLGESILGSRWLAEMREAAAASESGATIQLPARMLSRSQARLDGLIATTYDLRIDGDPAWRYGVLDARSPWNNYFLHAFVHESLEGIILSAVVLLLVGSALDLTWGSLIFAAFAIVAIPATAQCYRLLDASSGVPWSGGAGLAGALLGAYFIRGLGGHFIIPGWILLPTWIAVESFVVRGIWIDDLGRFPWATFCAAVGIGALVASALRLADVESNAQSRASKQSGRGPNPVIARAARLRSDGDPYQAFDLIQAGWRDEPGSEEIAEAFFSIAVEVGQPEAAAEAIVPSLRIALRKGDVSRAIEFWLPLATKECDVNLEATVAVRLAEALLDASHMSEALFTLRRALDIGVSAAQAARIFKIARDLDDGVARRAATIALIDSSLDPKIRAELESAAAIPSDSAPPDQEPETLAVSGAESQSQLDRRVEAEHQAVETTAFPIDEGLNLDQGDQGDLGVSDENEASLNAQALDADAFSEENLSAENPTDENAGDALSDRNDRDPLADDGAKDVSGDLEQDFVPEPLLDATSLESCGLDLGDRDLLSPSEGESDYDLTPLIDATDEQTSPLVSGVDGEDRNASQDNRSTAIFDQPRRPHAESDDPSPGEVGVPRPSTGQRLRLIKAIDAIPVATSDFGLEIDASSRGKSNVPFARVQLLAMAAVGQQGSRPVVIVDLVLNGSNGVDEPMKLIRFRSDRFDPLGLEPDAPNPLTALIAWVNRLQTGSNATCLPSREILRGELARFDSLEIYEREVLAAAREAEG